MPICPLWTLAFLKIDSQPYEDIFDSSAKKFSRACTVVNFLSLGFLKHRFTFEDDLGRKSESEQLVRS